MKNFISIAICIIVLLTNTACSHDKKIGLYGFLIDDYSGDSIECVAYTKHTKGEYGIYKVLTKFGEFDVDIPYLDDEECFDTYFIDNSISSYGQTLDSTFVFNECREAYESDRKRIKDYKNLKATYFVDSGVFGTLHRTDSSCVSNRKNITYVSNFSEALLFYAGMCDKCFQEMY